MPEIRVNLATDVAIETATTLLPTDNVLLFPEAGFSNSAGAGSEARAQANPPQKTRYINLANSYKGPYTTGQRTYGGELTTHLGDLHLCNFLDADGFPSSTTTTPLYTNTARWFRIQTGSNIKGDYVSTANIVKGDVWVHTGSHWLATADNPSNPPGEGVAGWLLIGERVKWRGEFQAGQTYYTEDLTVFRERTFLCTGGPTTVPPNPSASQWTMIAAEAIVVDSDGDVGIGHTPIVGSPLSVKVDDAHNLGFVVERKSTISAGEKIGMHIREGSTTHGEFYIDEDNHTNLYGRDCLDIGVSGLDPNSFMRFIHSNGRPAMEWFHSGTEDARLDAQSGFLNVKSKAAISIQSGVSDLDAGDRKWAFGTDGHFRPVPTSTRDIGDTSNRVRKLYVDTIDLTHGHFLPDNPLRTAFLRSDGGDPFWAQAGHWERGDVENFGSIAGVTTNTRITATARDPNHHDQYVIIDGHNNHIWYKGEGGTFSFTNIPLPDDPPWLESGHNIYLIGGASILTDGTLVVGAYAGERELVDGEYLYRVGQGHGRWVIYMRRLRERGSGGSANHTPANVNDSLYVRPFRVPTTPNEANFDLGTLWATTSRELGSESPASNASDIIYFTHCNDRVHTPHLVGYCALVFNNSAYTSPNSVATGPINRGNSRHIPDAPGWEQRGNYWAVKDNGEYSRWLNRQGNIETYVSFRHLVDSGEDDGFTQWHERREFDYAASIWPGHDIRAFDVGPRFTRPGPLYLVEWGGDRDIQTINRRIDLFDTTAFSADGALQEALPDWLVMGLDDDPRIGINSPLDVAFNLKANATHLTAMQIHGHGDPGSQSASVQMVLGQDIAAGNPGAAIRTTDTHGLDIETALGNVNIPDGQGDIRFRRDGTTLWNMEADGNLIPGDDDSQSLGSQTARLEEVWTRTVRARTIAAEAPNGPIILGGGGQTGEIFFGLQVGNDIRPSGSGKNLGDSANQWDAVHTRDLIASNAAGTSGLGKVHGIPVLNVFNTTSARNGAISSEEGALSVAGTDLDMYINGSWQKIGGVGIITDIPDVPWTAIPASLIPDSAGGRDVGSEAFHWGHGFFTHLAGPGSPAFLTIDRSQFTGRTQFPAQVFDSQNRPNIEVRGVARHIRHEVTSSGQLKVFARDDSTATQVGQSATVTKAQMREIIAATNSTSPQPGDVATWGTGNTLTWSQPAGAAGSFLLEEITSGASQGGWRVSLGSANYDITPQRVARAVSYSTAASTLEADRVLQIRQRGQIDSRQISDVIRDSEDDIRIRHHLRTDTHGDASDCVISHDDDHDSGFYFPQPGEVGISLSGAPVRLRGGNTTGVSNINTQILPPSRSQSDWSIHQADIGGAAITDLWNNVHSNAVTASVVQQPSSRAEKFRIEELPYADAVAALASFKVRRFRRKVEPDTLTVGPILEEFVSGSSGTLLNHPNTVNLSDLVWNLTKVVQEQARQLNFLRRHFGTLGPGATIPDFPAPPDETVPAGDRGQDPPGWTP